MHSRQAGFTIIELAIVVAIVSILASIAMPTLTFAQYKARRSEAALNIRGIAATQVAYHASNDAYVVEAPLNPGTALSRQQRSWDNTLPGWSDLGYSPDGAVRCNYATASYDGGSWFRVDAECDIDQDGKPLDIRWFSDESPAPGWVDLYPERF